MGLNVFTVALLGFLKPPEPGEQQAEVVPRIRVIWMSRDDLLIDGQRVGRPALVFQRKRSREKRLRFVQRQSFLNAAAPMTCIGAEKPSEM